MIRCTHQEREEVIQKASISGMSLSHYVLTCALGKELPTVIPDLNINGYALLQNILEQLEQLQQAHSTDLGDRLDELAQSIRQLRRDLIGLPQTEQTLPHSSTSR